METSDVLTALKQGRLSIQGEFLWGSNYTFFVQVEHAGTVFKAVYKPTRGERPLWDFPAHTLAKREVAAYLVSEALEWELVPPTVYRLRGPLGPGSLQVYIDHDPEYHYFNFSDEDRQRLRPVVLFDFLINNADRKGSHILKDPDGHLWLIDHGICFHVEDKLRTVIWDFVGQEVPLNLCADLQRFILALGTTASPTDLTLQLADYLDMGEIELLGKRAAQLAQIANYPAPDPHRRPYPWPQI